SVLCLLMRHSLELAAAEAKKQKRALPIFASNIFFGPTNRTKQRWPKASAFCLKTTAIRLAQNSKRYHNWGVKIVGRPSRLGGWSGRCASVALALAFCASAAADPSKNVVLRPQPQQVVQTSKK